MKTATDELNQQLPAPQIREVEPEKDFYWKPARIARLPVRWMLNFNIISFVLI